jgi:6-phosphogluconolactonase
MSELRAGQMPAALELVVAGDPIAHAGSWLTDCLRRLAARAGGAEIRIAIPGGSALVVVGRACAELGDIWRRVALTWVDERCVPVASRDSNRGEAMRLGILPPAPGIASSRAHTVSPARVLPLFEDGESPEEALARVARGYAEKFANGLDVAVLGMGADGHVASLFPGLPAPAADWVGSVAGPARDADGDSTAFVAYVPEAPKAPPRRITLTRAALACARHTLLVAAGEEKRSALERLCAGDPELPATGLPGLLVVTDLELGSRSTERPLESRRRR